MSRLMYYRDNETERFVRARDREIAKIRRSRPFWRQVRSHLSVDRLITQVILPTLIVLAIGEAGLYVHGRMPLNLNTPVDHGVQVSGAPTPGGQR